MMEIEPLKLSYYPLLPLQICHYHCRDLVRLRVAECYSFTKQPILFSLVNVILYRFCGSEALNLLA